MRRVIIFVGLLALAGCGSNRPVLPSATGPWTCLNCDKWASDENSITKTPPENGVVAR